jgi:hypothetical protein
MYGVSFVMLMVFLAVSGTFLVTFVWKWHVGRVGKSRYHRLMDCDDTFVGPKKFTTHGGTKDLVKKWTIKSYPLFFLFAELSSE